MLVRIGFEELDPRILPDMGVKVAFLEAAPAGDEAPRARLYVPRSAVRREAAVALHADKLIFLLEGHGVRDGRRRIIPQLSPGDADELLRSRRAMNEEARAILGYAVSHVPDSIWKTHVQVTGGLDGRVVVLLMHGHGPDPVVVPEDGRRAVSVVNIPIQNGDPLRLARVHGCFNGNCNVRQQAKSVLPLRQAMMPGRPG